MSKDFKRLLDLSLPAGQSAFLWGPRQTGKSTFLRTRFADARWIDLLDFDLALALTKRPSLLREWLRTLSVEERKHPVVIDEVQKVPGLLDEIHYLIEKEGLSFVLCGSSARKLKRGQANLLGGRAWRYEMFPLTSVEIGDLSLLRALQHGLLPRHYLQDNAARSLQAYTNDYLKEEIMSEGLVRNLPAFARFLDVVGFSCGELVNHASIARDVGVDAKTVREYFQILVDTLIGSLVAPFHSRRGRQTLSAIPRFYLCDVGLSNHLARRSVIALKGAEAGRAFEGFVFMELRAYLSYRGKPGELNYWRTKTGLEVDFVWPRERPVAIEAKISDRVDPHDLRGLKAFCEDAGPADAYVVCQEKHPRIVEIAPGQTVSILPWRDFLKSLWADQILR